LSSSRNILFVKWIESLLHTASKKFEFLNLESCFYNVKFRSWSSKPLSINAALDIA